jgi:CRP-like cAMP-binding protein
MLNRSQKLAYKGGLCHNQSMLATDKQTASLVELFGQGNRLKYKKGEFVIRPGQAPTGVFYIESGLVKAYDISKYGEENLLIIRKEQEIFPLIWAITGQERHIIYETISDTVLLQISRVKFFEFMRNQPDAIPPILDMIVEMYRIHSERLLNLEYRSVRERLISFLLIMSQRFGRQDGQNILIDAPMKQQDIASSINATRETTSREMAYLERIGLISNHNSKISLLDYEKLKSYL